MPVPPSQKQLVQIDSSLLDGGELKGVRCVAVKVVWYRMEYELKLKFRVANFPWLKSTCLNSMLMFMRSWVHAALGKVKLLKWAVKMYWVYILQLVARYSLQQYANITVEDLKVLLKFERSRTIWIWYDHSSLASIAWHSCCNGWSGVWFTCL